MFVQRLTVSQAPHLDAARTQTRYLFIFHYQNIFISLADFLKNILIHVVSFLCCSVFSRSNIFGVWRRFLLRSVVLFCLVRFEWARRKTKRENRKLDRAPKNQNRKAKSEKRLCKSSEERQVYRRLCRLMMILSAAANPSDSNNENFFRLFLGAGRR